MSILTEVSLLNVFLIVAAFPFEFVMNFFIKLKFVSVGLLLLYRHSFIGNVSLSKKLRSF